MKQLKPVRKVSAAGAAGSLTIILVWAATTYGGLEIPPEVASAFTTVVAFAAGWLVKS